MKKIRNLEPQEIEVRIAGCNHGGVELLLYKDARCDMSILDETFGPLGWQRKHSRDNRNCIVSVYDENSQQWISKEDVGDFSSDMEKEKTVASDSFKRACVNWGIGRELYTAPSIFIKKEFLSTYKTDESDKVSCFDKFCVKNIEYKGKQILSVTVANKNNGYTETFEGDGVMIPEPKKRGRKKTEPVEEISSVEESVIEEAPFVEEPIFEEESPIVADVEEVLVEEESPIVADVEEVLVEEESPIVADIEEVLAEGTIVEEFEEDEEDLPIPKATKTEIPDEEVILFGNCLGMTYGEAKVTPKFKNFLKWVQKNPEKKYDREEQNIQFAKLKIIAERESVA